MADDSPDTDAGFIRQRRNLIIVSLALLGALHYGLTFEKINILGNESKLPNSASVASLLWWFWAYFLWRYVTAYFDLGSTPAILPTYGNLFFRLMQKDAEKWWKKTKLKDSPAAKFDGVSAYESWNPRSPAMRISTTRMNPTEPNAVLQEHVVWHVPKTQCWKGKCVAGLQLTFQTSKISEYVVPYLVALVPVVYAAGKMLR